jgi:hypothetical protein
LQKSKGGTLVKIFPNFFIHSYNHLKKIKLKFFFFKGLAQQKNHSSF